jgi:ERCC4-related helicase
MPKNGIPYDAVKDPRITNESCWKAVDDNLLPNPPHDTEHPKDEVLAGLVKEDINKTKIIMAHEFRENAEGFKAMAEDVADSYNNQHKLRVGEELPVGFKEEEDG